MKTLEDLACKKDEGTVNISDKKWLAVEDLLASNFEKLQNHRFVSKDKLPGSAKQVGFDCVVFSKIFFMVCSNILAKPLREGPWFLFYLLPSILFSPRRDKINRNRLAQLLLQGEVDTVVAEVLRSFSPEERRFLPVGETHKEEEEEEEVKEETDQDTRPRTRQRMTEILEKKKEEEEEGGPAFITDPSLRNLHKRASTLVRESDLRRAMRVFEEPKVLPLDDRVVEELREKNPRAPCRDPDTGKPDPLRLVRELEESLIHPLTLVRQGENVVRKCRKSNDIFFMFWI